jgi:hypothetical protein
MCTTRLIIGQFYDQLYVLPTGCVYCAVRSTLNVLATQCVYVFCVDLRTNSGYFTVQH